MNLGFHPRITCVELDLWNIEKTAETLAHVKPDIIFHAASLMSWWVPSKLPAEIAQELAQACSGWRLPMHLTLLKRLMEAIEMTGLNPRVINAAYPDATNTVLRNAGFKGPEVGIGNVGNVVPGIRRAVAHLLGEDITDVDVRLVAQHHFSFKIPSRGTAEGLPYHMTTLLRGIDVTHQLDLGTLFGLLPVRFKRTRGIPAQINTASSAMSIITELAESTGKVVHAPGPNGIVGGYPVQIDEHGTHIVLPDNLTLDEAIAINEAGQRLDGIERIDQNGTVHFTESHMEIVKRILNYERHTMTVEEIEDCAQEIEIKFAELSANHRLIGVSM